MEILVPLMFFCGAPMIFFFVGVLVGRAVERRGMPRLQSPLKWQAPQNQEAEWQA